ncbi:MAG: hypothetical protein KI786_00210, partial [Mameliella sp.]|nr:hypothetical protein [Phaeodactylibacter sp.]
MLMISGLHTATGQTYVTYGLYGKYDEDPKSYFLRVQFNFIDVDAPNEDAAWWEVGGYVLADEAQKGLDNLNQAFNPHGIFFLADEPTPDCASPATYRTYFDLQNPQGLSVLDLVREEYQTEDEVRRALNIYVSTDQGPTGGWAFEVPSNFVALNGNEDGELATNTTTAVHEVGHALGLLHTFAGRFADDPLHECDEGTATNGNCIEPDNLCFCCGDYVCDTGYNLDNDINLDPNDCMGSESIPESVRRNYMNYVTPGSCRNAFTPQQGLRMKKYLGELHDHPNYVNLLYDIQVLEGEYPSETPSGITGNFTVKEGVLDLQSDLQMLPGAVITVKSGAVLNVKATITSACDEMWQGIKVKPGGRVKVFGQGVIEHAICGIDARGISSEVIVFGGAFFNNTISLRVDTEEPGPTANQVFYGEFELNDQYKGPTDERPYFIILRGNRGTRIRYTTFRDERAGDCSGSADCTARAVGILAEDASFTCSSNTVFSELLKGIEVSNLGIEQGSYTVRNCTFTDNLIGIVSRECSSLLIEDNTFQLNRASNYENFEPSARSLGVELIGESQGFTIAGNEFLQLYQPSSFQDCNYFGTICSGTGQGLNNEVINNDYIAMEVGNAARGNNGGIGIPGGVVYLCNDHSKLEPGISPPPDGCANYLVQPGATIRQMQHGSDEDEDILPTGNIFSSYVATIKNGDENGQNFYTFTYYYQGDDADQNPGSPVGVDVQPLPDMPNCDEAPCSAPCPEDPILIKARFQEFGLRADSLKLLAEVLTGNDKAAAEQASLFFGQLRNEAAGRVLQHYALDTTAVEADSIRHWLYNANTFGSLYLLAREQFFFGDTAVFQLLWERIPQLVDLTPYQASTYSDLSALFNILKPYLAEGGELHELPKPLIEVLYSFTFHCNEAGFLSAALLQRNGVEATVPCNGQSQALAQKGSPERQAQNIRRSKSSPQASLFPNPTTGT